MFISPSLQRPMIGVSMQLQRIFVLLVSAAAVASAQNDRSSLSGTVTDATGSVVTGARVQAVSDATGFHRTTLTGAAGTYHIEALGIGTFTVTFSKTGFRSAEVKG